MIQPLARVLIRLGARLGIDPLRVVLAHGSLGVLAAALIALGPATWPAAAIMLQLKTLLDNVDGGLARATGRVTQMGRYLDTVVDLLVNVLLFAALAAHGPPLAAFGALLLLTLILSWDYNLERLYRYQRSTLTGIAQNEAQPPLGATQASFDRVQAVYRLLLAPQDRLVETIERRLFERLSGLDFDRAPLEYRLAWSDMFSTATLVNLGLSTQLLLLGIFLLIDQPFWYVWSLYLQAGYVVAVQWLRVRRFRQYLELRRSDPLRTRTTMAPGPSSSSGGPARPVEAPKDGRRA